MSTTTERLEELLDAKDEKIEALEKKVAEYEETLRIIEDHEGNWARPVYTDEDPVSGSLPTPRFQVACRKTYGEDSTWENTTYTLSLVFRRECGDEYVAVPIERCKSSGWRDKEPDITDSVQLPSRMMVNVRADKKATGWPAYLVVGSKIQVI